MLDQKGLSMGTFCAKDHLWDLASPERRAACTNGCPLSPSVPFPELSTQLSCSTRVAMERRECQAKSEEAF